MAKPKVKKTKRISKSTQNWRRFEDRAARFICGGFLIAAIILFFYIVFIVIWSAIKGGWCIDTEADVLTNVRLFWEEHSLLIKAFFYSLTLFVASHTLIKYIDVETSRSLGEIRSKLNDEPKKIIHNSLLLDKDLETIKKYLKGKLETLHFSGDNVDLTEVEVLDYLGTLELGAIMLQRGLLSNNEFYDQFGYRYENLKKSSLNKLFSTDKKFYNPLLYAMSVVDKKNDQIQKKEARAKKRAKKKSPKSKPSAVKSDSSLVNNEG